MLQHQTGFPGRQAAYLELNTCCFASTVLSDHVARSLIDYARTFASQRYGQCPSMRLVLSQLHDHHAVHIFAGMTDVSD